MRFGRICLILSLLVPTFVASHRLSPNPPPPPNLPSHPYPNLPPTHGDIVGYAANGLHSGIVVGSPSHPEGKVNIAPITTSSRGQLVHTSVRHDRVVNAHPDDILTTGVSIRHKASEAARHHERNPPSVSRPTGPYPGSANYGLPRRPHSQGRR